MPVKILVIGDIIIDRYYYVTSEKMSQEALLPILHVKSSEEKLGGAGKTATSLQELLDVTNADIKGCYAGLLPINWSSIPGLESYPVYIGIGDDSNQYFFSYKNRIISESPYQQLTRFDQDVIIDIDSLSDARQSIQDRIESALKSDTFNITIVSDYDKGSIDKNILSLVREKSDIVIYDPRTKKQTYYTEYVDMVTPNKDEYLKLFPDPRIWTEYNNNKYRAIINKVGKDGCRLYYSDIDCHLPNLHRQEIPTTSNRPIINTIGAGDVFAAALSVALGTIVNLGIEVDKAENLKLACGFASAVATISTWNQNCSPGHYETENKIKENLKSLIDVLS